MARKFIDKRLRGLQDEMERFEADLRAKFKDLVTRPPAEQFAAFRGILATLASIRSRVSIFATSQLQTFYRETLVEIAKRLSKAGLRVDPTVTATATLELGRGMLADVDRALASVRVLAQRGLDREYVTMLSPSQIATLGPDELVPTAAKAFLAKASEHQVSVPLSGGRSRAFGLAYYMSLVLASAFGRARVKASTDVAGTYGLDLVRVSPNPSTIGDFCDAYAGKVFSISGNHPVAPPIAQTVGGGPPFHVNCLHWVEPLPEDYEPKASEIVPRKWLARNASEEARIVKDWGRSR